MPLGFSAPKYIEISAALDPQAQSTEGEDPWLPFNAWTRSVQEPINWLPYQKHKPIDQDITMEHVVYRPPRGDENWANYYTFIEGNTKRASYRLAGANDAPFNSEREELVNRPTTHNEEITTKVCKLLQESGTGTDDIYGDIKSRDIESREVFVEPGYISITNNVYCRYQNEWRGYNIPFGDDHIRASVMVDCKMPSWDTPGVGGTRI